MWIATREGFFSIARGPGGPLHVCARSLRDLASLVRMAGLDVNLRHASGGDNVWTIAVEPEHLPGIVSALASTIDYENFCHRLRGIPGQKEKLPLYEALWSGLTSVRKVAGEQDL